MTAPIGKPAHALAPRKAMHPEDRCLVDDARAVFASIDTDELARALAPWLGTGLSAANAAAAVKAHLGRRDPRFDIHSILWPCQKNSLPLRRAPHVRAC